MPETSAPLTVVPDFLDSAARRMQTDFVIRTGIGCETFDEALDWINQKAADRLNSNLIDMLIFVPDQALPACARLVDGEEHLPITHELITVDAISPTMLVILNVVARRSHQSGERTGRAKAQADIRKSLGI